MSLDLPDMWAALSLMRAQSVSAECSVLGRSGRGRTVRVEGEGGVSCSSTIWTTCLVNTFNYLFVAF